MPDMKNLRNASFSPFGIQCDVQTAGDLLRECVFIDIETLNRDVFALFEGTSSLINIPVMESNELVGIINRDSFMRSMARRFHWELYASKRCSKMMNSAPVVIDATTPIWKLADQLLTTRETHDLSEGFIIRKGKKLVGSALTSDVLAALLIHERLLSEELSRANTLLAELSITDSLTGLFNRRHFNETLERELARAHRQGESIGLIMIDIDFFKKLNDNLGHHEGDRTLQDVATTLKKCLRRSTDLCFRIGGEEFAVLTPGFSDGTVPGFSEALRKAVEARNLPNPGNTNGIVTISIGVAGSLHSSDSSNQIFVRADQALYAAKASGRNCVVLFDELITRHPDP
jgi:diguanylate cyclase (GGDEF)-like protein